VCVSLHPNITYHKRYQDSVKLGGPVNKSAKGKKHSRYGSTGGKAFVVAEDGAKKDKDSVKGYHVPSPVSIYQLPPPLLLRFSSLLDVHIPYLMVRVLFNHGMYAYMYIYICIKVVGSDFSFHESIRKMFWKGDIAERHYRFLHKLKEAL
jgi:hypothetical protein